MKVYLKGGGEVNLTNRYFVAEGGQGKIYARRNVVYKVYHDASDMMPLGKIKELSVLKKPCFIKPEQILLNDNGDPIGYTMKFIKGGISLCQLFTPAYRKREGVTHKQIWGIIKKIQEGIKYAHQNNILLVDINEFNFLVDPNYKEVYFIDADSYQTPHYPASALMESVKDWKADKFTELSDWFSFGVLAFQLFVGVHPFRGKYRGRAKSYKQKLARDDPNDAFAITRRRMKKHISVFNDQVGVPRVAYPFSVIPINYLEWFKAIFEDGKRLPPPHDADTQAVVVKPRIDRTPSKTNNFDIIEIGTYEGEIHGVWMHRGDIVVSTDQGVWLNKHKVITNSAMGVGFSARRNHAVAITKGVNPAPFDLTSRKEIPFGSEITNVMSYGGRLYMKSQDQIIEMVISDLGAQTVISSSIVATVLENATRMYEGCVVQDLLGTTFISMFPASGSVYQKAIPDLQGYHVVEAKYDNKVLVVIGEKNGSYNRFVFRFSEDHQKHDMRQEKNITHTGINFVTLDTGVCVLLNEEEKLELFSNRMGSQRIKIVEDDALNGAMTLSKQEGQVIFYNKDKLYQMKMR